MCTLGCVLAAVPATSAIDATTMIDTSTISLPPTMAVPRSRARAATTMTSASISNAAAPAQSARLEMRRTQRSADVASELMGVSQGGEALTTIKFVVRTILSDILWNSYLRACARSQHYN